MTTSPYDDEQAGPACEQSPSSSKGDPAGFAGWTKEGGPPLPPLMQHPTASVAAAAAMGFGMASHFAGFMLGAMQGFMEAAQKAAATAEAERQAGQGTASAGKAEGAPGRAVEPGIADEAAPETDAGLPAEPVTALNATAAEAAAAVMKRASAAVAETTPRTANETRPAAKAVRARRGKVADDLKKISGIGPKLEQVLKSFEVTRFSEIAAWDENDITRFDRELNVSGRIVRDRWVEQAKVLAKS